MVATMVGMTAMMVGIMIGLPIVANMAILMGSIYAIIRWRSGKATYSLDSKGFTQVIKPFWGSTPTIRRIEFNDIKSYVTGRDRKRDLEEFHFLKIKLKRSHASIVISDQKGDKEAFANFRDHFEKMVELNNDDPRPSSTSTSMGKRSYAKSATKPRSQQNQKVIKRKNFYERPFAKVLTLFFIVTCLFFLVLWYNGMMNIRNLFRLLVIIIPGTIYMVSRVFFPREKKE